jgi:hypothetical protein
MTDTAAWLEELVAAHERFDTVEFLVGDAAKVMVLENKRMKRELALTLAAALRALEELVDVTSNFDVDEERNAGRAVLAQADKLREVQEVPI